MSTTKSTGTRRAVKAAIAVEQSLDDFTRALDGYLNRNTGFGDLCRDLWYVRQQLAMIEARRAAIFALVKTQYEAGVRNIITGPGSGYVIKESAPSEVVYKRNVPSRTLEKYDRGLWLRCKVARPYVSVSAGGGFDNAEVKLPRHLALPEVPGWGAGPREIVETYRSVPSTSELRELETAIIADLEVIGRDGQWDGLPLTFKDGWTAGLRRLMYDADELQKIAPEVYDRLAVTSQIGGTSRVLVAALTPQAVAESGDGYST